MASTTACCRPVAAYRRAPILLGWILIGCAGFSALLALGLIFWFDRSGEPA